MVQLARFALPAVAIILTALACAARPASDRAKLAEAVRTYNNLQRWGQWQAAAQYVETKQAQAWLQRRQRAGDVRVADMQLLQVLPGEKPDSEAVALVRVSWYRMPEMRLTTITRQQKWRKLDAGWRVVDEAAVEAPAAPAADDGSAWP
jgi:hypothetical protein